MSGDSGIRDTDLGMEKIRAQIAALAELSIKAGILEDAGSRDGVPVAEYAAWNEYGVPGTEEKWAIPPRPFIRGYVDDNGEKIKNIQEMLVAQVIDGKIDPDTAADKLGKNTKEGIKHYIKTSSNFTPNAPATVKRKGTNRPLVETGLLRRSVNYKVVKGSK